MKRKWIVLLIVVVIFAAVMIFKDLSTSDGTKKANVAINSKMVMIVEKGEMRKLVSATGYLQPVQDKNLNFTLNGEIDKIYVEEGQRVNAEQKLIQLDKTQQELSFQQAKNAYESAKINGSPTNIREKDLNLQVAQENLATTTLTAPFAGLVTKISVEEGDYTLSNGPGIIRIIDDTNYEIAINVDEIDSQLVELDQSVIISVDAIPKRQFRGKVTEIAYQTENINGVVTLPVTVLVEEVDSQFRPGFSTELDIVVGKVSDQIIVPMTALINNNGQEKVIKVIDNKPQPVAVQTGMSNGLQVVIEKGLEPGDKILINAVGFAGGDKTSQVNMFMRPPGSPGGSGRGGK